MPDRLVAVKRMSDQDRWGPILTLLAELIDALANEPAPVDLGPLTARIVALEAAVAALQVPPTPAVLLTQFAEALEAVVQAPPGKPASFTVTINAERNSQMAFQIVDSDTGRVASVTYVDALGFPTTDEGATVSFSSSDDAVLTVDASSGAVTPVAPGNAQVQASVTNSDGSSISGVPADVEVIAGAAASFSVSVA